MPGVHPRSQPQRIGGHRALPRRKLRIRHQGDRFGGTDDTTVHVEIKQRVNRVTQQRRVPLRYRPAGNPRPPVRARDRWVHRFTQRDVLIRQYRQLLAGCAAFLAVLTLVFGTDRVQPFVTGPG
ncbi:hypothetical protein Daura_33910 [Dactylosporangium aurantiacum]|uniref:Uncharacterized protein n=1 Tax=Dactylosporangium aurantiacum TaxID=35754 RepID=A0A9Q9IAW6_9ACTN|nr:hypothetical protein [Dactylosporangium aurantiacum]MDG6105190.1 hypothetical protein [Dactylosporangium aurantiacum]UWZ51711.1 hypothetical protein Daura_33910 [Dactylosporangium aurantiacum]